MTYVREDFASKRLLKAAVERLVQLRATVPTERPNPLSIGAVMEDKSGERRELQQLERQLEVKQIGPFPPKRNGEDSVEGPHFPKPHKWYARVQVQDGIVVRVIS